MKKVVCIKDDEQGDDVYRVKKGRIYTVIEEGYRDFSEDYRYIYQAGVYYTLAEMGDNVEFYSGAFLDIEEDQQDETEMIREYNTVKA